VIVCCSVLQCVAVCCSVLQCAQVLEGVLQCVAVSSRVGLPQRIHIRVECSRKHTQTQANTRIYTLAYTD